MLGERGGKHDCQARCDENDCLPDATKHHKGRRNGQRQQESGGRGNCGGHDETRTDRARNGTDGHRLDKPADAIGLHRVDRRKDHSVHREERQKTDDRANHAKEKRDDDDAVLFLAARLCQTDEDEKHKENHTAAVQAEYERLIDIPQRPRDLAESRWIGRHSEEHSGEVSGTEEERNGRTEERGRDAGGDGCGPSSRQPSRHEHDEKEHGVEDEKLRHVIACLSAHRDKRHRTRGRRLSRPLLLVAKAVLRRVHRRLRRKSDALAGLQSNDRYDEDERAPRSHRPSRSSVSPAG
jgi:hypothetical protein